jgi:gamma-butyrobetaine dioxygenase
MRPWVEITEGGRSLRIGWPDGEGAELGARWLLDHADGARDPVSGQRGAGALKLGDPVRIRAARIEGVVLRVELASGVTCGVCLERLRRRDRPRQDLWLTPELIAWAKPMGFDDYLSDEAALRETLSRVSRLGLARLDGAGAQPGAVERAVVRFGFIRETNYGRIFDVKITASPANLAFSDKGLELHTDNPYRDPPPTLQLLHAITADPEGGETVFVDGFAHAEALRREAPEDFDLLAHTRVRFSYAEASGARWMARAPVIELAADGEMLALRLNHRSLDLEPGGGDRTERWYDAYLGFQRRVHAPGAAFERALAPGEMVIFDNLRILHGRRPLTGGSPRWLQGCYADRDGLGATLKRLQASISGERADGR